MALPDVSFTNNLGTVTFKRSQVSVGDAYQWDGRTVNHRKQVQVDAWVSRDVTERLSGVLRPLLGPLGQRGLLTVPWTALQDMRLESLVCEPGGWQDLVQVSATFSDDRPANNLYKVTFFGLELYHPKLSLPIPSKSTNDYYAQVPLGPLPGGGEIASDNAFIGPIRFRTGYAMMQMVFSGVLRLEAGTLPADLVAKLSKRMGVTGGETGDIADLPPGYPCVFKLGEAIPELAGSLTLNGVFVAGGRIMWDVEKNQARVQLSLLAQPQKWAEV